MKYLLIFFLTIISYKASCQTWQNVGIGLDREVYDLVTFENNLYAGGKMGVAYWDASVWTLLPKVNGIWSPLSLQVYKDTLYVAGDNAFGGSISGVFKYDGSNWIQAGGDFNDEYWSATKDMTTYNNKLVAGGSFSSIGTDSIENIAIWNGSTWDSLGLGLNNLVTDVYEHENKLFAVGQFTASGSDTLVKTVAYWNGTKWYPLDSNQMITSASRIISFENSLIIGNVWDTLNGNPMKGIAKWNGTNFSSMGNNLIKQVSNFWVYDNELFMSGAIDNLNPYGSDHVVLKWNGFFWQQLGLNFDHEVIVISDYNSEIFCGGFFEDKNYIAKFSNPVGLESVQSNTFQLYPNPCSKYFTITNISVPSDLKIYNLAGNLVINSKIELGNSRINISKLSPGSYILIVENERRKSSMKLFVY